MKGLLLKDLYMALKYCRAYLLISALFAVLSLFSDNLFLLLYPVLMAGAIPVNLISYDEKSGWGTYSGTLPYTRRQLVSAKYLVALIALGVGMVLVGMIQLLRLVYTGESWQEYGQLLLLLPAVSLIVPCLLLPVVFKYGVEKGRLVFYAVVIVVAGGFGALGAVLTDDGFAVGLPALGAWLAPTAFLAALLLLAGSWLLSIRFYEKREL